MTTEAICTNDVYSRTNAITTITTSDGPIARFPYNPSDDISITQRYLDIFRFTAIRTDITIVEVIGAVVPTTFPR